MRLPKRFATWALATVLWAAAAAADPALVTVSGKVEIGRGFPPVWQLARSGDTLAPGDSVRTAAGARAELALGDQRVVRVYERSVLRVGTGVTPAGAVRSVDLDEGQSIFDVMKKTIADEFEVITPEIVVSVKGTRFLVAAVDGTDYTAVFRGEVALAGGFETVAVRPGMLGAGGELFLAPFSDPWAAWESGSPAPEAAVDEGREREVGEAIQAAVGGGSDRDADETASAGSGLLGGVFGALADVTAGDGGANESTLVGDVLAPVTEPLGGTGAALGGAVGGLTGELLGPVGGLTGELLGPVGGAVDPLLPAPLEPPTGGGGLLGGLLGGGS
jgi:hypothetical protein